MRFFNSQYLIKILHKKRIYAVLLLSSLSKFAPPSFATFIGFIIISVSNTATSSWGFYTALIGSALCGSMSSLGESVVVGFLKDFPAN